MCIECVEETGLGDLGITEGTEFNIEAVLNV
jgi:hypothetical protein